MLSFVQNLENMVNQLDNCIIECSLYEMESNKLSDIRNSIVIYIEEIKDSISFKIERLEVYGIPLEDEDLENIDPELLLEIQRETDLIMLRRF